MSGEQVTLTSSGAQPSTKYVEIVVLFKPNAGVQASRQGLVAAPSSEPHPVQDILKQHNATMRPLFGPTEERVRLQLSRMASESAASTPSTESSQPESSESMFKDLSLFYNTHISVETAEEVRKQIFANDSVAAAYIKPSSGLPIVAVPAARTDEPPAATPNFVSNQIYLNSAPAGIDAKYAWTVPGGTGKNTRITDCEWGWRFTHEDLVANQAGVVAGTSATELTIETNPPDDDDHKRINHGTAVLGIISGDSNAFGVTGITPDSTISASSFMDQSVSQAIKAAADKLSAGDVILLEIHSPGPNAPSPPPFKGDQHGFIAVEWWPDDFAAIQYAVNKGITVIEAGGNGFENLDAAIYNTPQAGFPVGWKNPFARGGPDSGAIMVGAGAPPNDTHSQNWGPDRSKLDFSNYGSRIDVQGWGREVTSTGYGDLQGGLSKDIWYTNTFSGTSSASPMVTGTVLSIQGALKARGKRKLTPREARLLLRLIGSPQVDNSPSFPLSFRIGKRPNLRTLIPAALKLQSRSGDFDRDRHAEILTASQAGIALLKTNGLAFQSLANVQNNTRVGQWLLNFDDNSLGPVADYDGDGAAETLITSPWGIGVLKTSGSTMTCPYLQANHSFAGGWNIDTTNNCFGPAGDFDGDGKAEIFVSSPWGIGLFKFSGSAMATPFLTPNGTRFSGPANQSWLLNTGDNEFGPIGDYSGSQRAEILLVSPWGIGIARFTGTGMVMLAMAPNGTRFPGPGGQSWLLNTNDNRFGPSGDYDGDGRSEILVTSPWGIGVIKLSGSTFVMSVMAANGTRFAAAGGASWLLNTNDNQFMLSKKLLPGNSASLVVVSPWGIGILGQAGGTFSCQLISQNGTRFQLGNTPGQGWLLNTANDWLGSAADYDGDGQAEILISSPWGIGCLKLQAPGRLVAIAMQPNGPVGRWNLDTAANDFGHGV